MMEHQEAKNSYILYLADNAVILGQRLGEWCGHGPVLEQDMAMTNIALDNIGRSRLLYQYASELTGNQQSEDQIAFLRNEWEYRNLLLVEQPNGDFAHTIARQFFLDAFHFPYFKALINSADTALAAIAEKTLKETAYHLKWSSEWVLRLGDGTELSHQKMQNAVDALWTFTGEMFMESDFEKQMRIQGISPDLDLVREVWMEKIQSILTQATLKTPQANWMQSGGKQGNHSEYLGYILSEMQYMQRAYPNMEW